MNILVILLIVVILLVVIWLCYKTKKRIPIEGNVYKEQFENVMDNLTPEDVEISKKQIVSQLKKDSDKMSSPEHKNFVNILANAMNNITYKDIKTIHSLNSKS